MLPIKKHLLHLSILCAVLLSSCTESLTYEQNLVNHYYQFGQEHNLDIRQAWKLHEQELIEKGLLKDSTAASYYTIFLKMKQQEDYAPWSNVQVPVKQLDSLKNDLLIEKLRERYTTQWKGSPKHEDSPSFRVEQKITGLYREPVAEVAMMGYLITHEVEPEEFEQDFFKLVTLGFLPVTLRKEEGKFLYTVPLFK